MSRTSDWYSRFAQFEAHDESPIYEDWANRVAIDNEILGLLEDLPLAKRQPNLIFAVSRLLGAPEGAFPQFRRWLLANWPAVRGQASVRMTQTNEPRRCASLLPALAGIPGPLALLEVGASAGLCLYPDRYSYSYDGGEPLHPADGPSTVLLECETSGGVPVPAALPTVVWRAGIDLQPLALDSADDMLWLQTLIWPEQQARRERLRAAREIAMADPPLLVRGDATDALPALVAQAPQDATLVVFHSGTLVYLSAEDRARFARTIRSLGTRWISQEGVAVLPDVERELSQDAAQERALFVLAVDGHPVARVGPHGQRVDWIPAR